jgi:CheY-like chemotaxis protein
MKADFEIAGKATNGIEMVAEAARLQPDLIVTDLNMPGLRGMEASRAALKDCPGIPIVLLMSYRETGISYKRH